MKESSSEMARQVSDIDLTGCPHEFREIFVQYVSAWKNMAEVVRAQPEGVMQGAVAGFQNSLTRHELDGGTSRMIREREQAYKSLQAARTAVQAVAARF